MIRLWEQRDIIQLRKLIVSFIEDQNRHGCDIELCDENVNFYLRLGFEQSKLGQPHLVYEEQGRILAYIQLGECLFILKFRKKTAELFSIFTLPEARHRFLSIELIREGAQKIVELGFEKIYSTVFLSNYTMLKNVFYNPAIWPMSVRAEWDIANDAQFQQGQLVSPIRKIA